MILESVLVKCIKGYILYYIIYCMMVHAQLIAQPGDNDAAIVLREICCLLADYCSTHRQKDSHKLAADYYFVSMLPIGEVCDRFNDQKKVLRSH